MPYYQRLGKIDRRNMTYGRGRFSPTSYKNYRGANIFTDIFEIGEGFNNAFLHGRIYDPSELGVDPPYPETVTIDNVIYQYNPNDIPANRNQPFNPNVTTYNGRSNIANTPENLRKINGNELASNRGMQGVDYGNNWTGINPGIYREKNQSSDNYSPQSQPVFEQSSVLSQQLRRNIIKGSRLNQHVNPANGSIVDCGEKSFIGEAIASTQGDKDVFFLNPANRPEDGSHKDLG